VTQLIFSRGIHDVRKSSKPFDHSDCYLVLTNDLSVRTFEHENITVVARGRGYEPLILVQSDDDERPLLGTGFCKLDAIYITPVRRVAYCC